jgi:hypothetical protein
MDELRGRFTKSGQEPIKYHKILTITCNENGGFAGLSAMFAPSRENSCDKVQRDTQRGRLQTGSAFQVRHLLDDLRLT